MRRLIPFAFAVLLPASAFAQITVVSRESLGRIPTSGTDDFRLITNTDLSKVAAIDRWGAEHKWYVVQNSLVWEFYNELDAPSAQFSADGNHLSMLAKHDGDWYLVTDNKDVRKLGSDPCRGLVLSPDGKHDACIQTTKEGQQVLIDGKPMQFPGTTATYDEVAGLTYSKDGRLAISARAAGKAIVVLDGKILASAPADQIFPLSFSDDQSQVICNFRKRDAIGDHLFRITQDQIAELFYVPPGSQLSCLTQSSNAQHLAWAENDGLVNVIKIDGEIADRYTGTFKSVVIAPNGKTWAALAVDNSALSLRFNFSSFPLSQTDYSLSITPTGVVHCVNPKDRLDVCMVNGQLRTGTIDALGNVEISKTTNYVYINNRIVPIGAREKALGATVTDSQTASILSSEPLPLKVGNEEKVIGELTRTVVKVSQP